MMGYRKQIIHAILQATYAAAPTFAATDAIRCGNLNPEPLQLTRKQRENIQQFFGNQGSIVVKKAARIPFRIELSGSGTPGNAPPFGYLFLACNFSENILSADVSATAQAGGSTTSIKLAAAASAIDDYYIGMPIKITAGAGNEDAWHIIVGYDGTTKIATIADVFTAATDITSEYTIGKNVRYLPVSDVGTASNTAVAFAYNHDGVEHISLGARGNVKAELKANDIPYIDFDFMALYDSTSDNAPTDADFSAWIDPEGFMTATASNINLAGLKAPNAVLSNVNVDTGNKTVYPDLVGQDAVLLTARQCKASFEILAVKNAVKNWWAQAEANGTGVFCVSHGTTDGNRCAIIAPVMQPSEPKYSNVEELSTHKIDAELKPYANGNNELIFTFY